MSKKFLAHTVATLWDYRPSLVRHHALQFTILMTALLASVVLAAGHHTAAASTIIAVPALLGLGSQNKFLYTTREARMALGCGVGKLYVLINTGQLDAKRFGKRTYITRDSLERFVAALPNVTTPTRAKIEHERWLRQQRATNPQQDEAE